MNEKERKKLEEILLRLKTALKFPESFQIDGKLSLAIFDAVFEVMGITTVFFALTYFKSVLIGIVFAICFFITPIISLPYNVKTFPHKITKIAKKYIPLVEKRLYGEVRTDVEHVETIDVSPLKPKNTISRAHLSQVQFKRKKGALYSKAYDNNTYAYVNWSELKVLALLLSGTIIFVIGYYFNLIDSALETSSIFTLLCSLSSSGFFIYGLMLKNRCPERKAWIFFIIFAFAIVIALFVAYVIEVAVSNGAIEFGDNFIMSTLGVSIISLVCLLVSWVTYLVVTSKKVSGSPYARCGGTLCLLLCSLALPLIVVIVAVAFTLLILSIVLGGDSNGVLSSPSSGSNNQSQLFSEEEQKVLSYFREGCIFKGDEIYDKNGQFYLVGYKLRKVGNDIQIWTFHKLEIFLTEQNTWNGLKKYLVTYKNKTIGYLEESHLYNHPLIMQ